MKAFGKILGLGLLGLLLIIVALGFALTHLFDPNDYKDEIRQLARDKAHVELTLNGDIGWSLFPWLGLELHEASIATLNKPTEPFADLQMLGLSVRVLPLLRREVQMSDVRVEGLNLTLARDEQGHGNWEDIGKPLPAKDGAAASTPAPAEQPGAPAESSSERTVKLDIDSLTVNNARVQYTDAKTGKSYSAESIQLSTGPVHEGANIPLKASAFLSASQPNLKARTELAGELRFDRKLKRYNFEDMRLTGETSGEPLAGKTMTFAAQGQVLVDMAANVASWNGLKISANQLRALGELNLRDLDKAPQLSGGLSIAQFDLRTFLDGIGHPLPATNDPAAFNKLELVSRLQGTPNSLALEDLAVKLDDSTFSGRVAVEDFAKQALRVKLKGDKFDADRYMELRWQDAYHQFSAAENEQQLFQRIAAYSKRLGFEYCCYGIRVPLPVSKSAVAIFDTYPDGWMAHYQAQDYIKIDSTVRDGALTTNMIVWPDVDEVAPCPLWEDAREAGLSVGIAQSSWAARGAFGLLSIARHADRLTPAEIDMLTLQTHWLANLSHSLMSGFMVPKLAPAASVVLTAREREVLCWTAEGKTACEIGQILGIAERTVTFHVNNVLVKLGATNKVQAVVKAVSAGLIDMF